MTVVGQQLINSVRAHAAQNPDFVYKSPDWTGSTCVYVYNGCASCLIGQALFDLGLINPSMETSQFNDFPIREIILDVLGLRFDAEELQWLSDVQTNQDLGNSWGDSVKLADQAFLARMMDKSA